MAFSYSGLTNYGKVSLPSIESWSTNNNILRDPPKSIFTRRVDKVGDNSYITQEIDDSSDRVAEAILAYPRGINPMVAVSYDNSNGGIGVGQAALYRGQQAKLPYRVDIQGAFRPPVLAPVDLLPLSRMPRNTTKIDPVMHNPDYTRQVVCRGGAEDYRAVKNEQINTCANSNIYFKTGQASEIDTKHSLKNRLQTEAGPIIKYQRAKDQRNRYTKVNIKEAPVRMGEIGYSTVGNHGERWEPNFDSSVRDVQTIEALTLPSWYAVEGQRELTDQRTQGVVEKPLHTDLKVNERRGQAISRHERLAREFQSKNKSYDVGTQTRGSQVYTFPEVITSRPKPELQVEAYTQPVYSGLNNGKENISNTERRLKGRGGIVVDGYAPTGQITLERPQQHIRTRARIPIQV